MFLPATIEEMRTLGWTNADIILVSADAYIDSPFSGVSLIGKTLMAKGWRVAVISQPDVNSAADIMRLGSPALYWGVTAGLTDSLVANYTASGKRRHSCDFTPGGVNNKRPDRASIVYTNLIKRFDPHKKPVVLGGIEASLRRFSHYDFLTEKIRRPLLPDAKADFLIYGMGEYPCLQLAEALAEGKDTSQVANLVYMAKVAPEGAVILPSHEEVAASNDAFADFFRKFYDNNANLSGNILAQACGNRYVVQNPSYVMGSEELDFIHSLDYERAVHPRDAALGEVRGAETVRFSIASHRGCFGECNFCAISIHQGRRVVSRSKASIMYEAVKMSKSKAFKGIISDVGGPTANMYGAECKRMKDGKPCPNKHCLFPSPCPSLVGSHKSYTELLRDLAAIKSVKKVLVASGIRCDMAVADKKEGLRFIKALAAHHTGGQIKLAPEHTDDKVLQLMGKSGIAPFISFMDAFAAESYNAGKQQFISCYFMAAHPGCDMAAMKQLHSFIKGKLHFKPQQVQIFTPTPSTWSTCMYVTGLSQSGEKLHVARTYKEKDAQKKVII